MTAAAPGRRGAWIFCGLALLLLLSSWGRYLDTPFSRVLGFADWIGNENGRIAWNHVRYGFATTRGAQVRNLEVVPPADRIVYHIHPGTLDALTGVVFGIVGRPAIWAHRLLPLLGSLLALFFLARLARALGSDPPLVAGTLAVLPMTNVHGVNFSYEPLCLAAITGIVLLHHRGWRWGLLPLIWLFGLIDYPVLYLTPYFALVTLLRRERGVAFRLGFAAALGVTGLASIGTHLLHLLWSMGGLRAGHGASFDEYLLLVATTSLSVLPPLAEFVRVQLEWLTTGYTLPLLLAAFVGLVRLARDPRQRTAAFAFFWVGMLHFAVFPAHADKHDFWLCYLAPFVALASVRALRGAPPAFTLFVLFLAAGLGAIQSERIWRERAAPPVRALGQDLAAHFAPEEVLVAFRTPANWALETFRGHPIHEGEPLFQPGAEATQWERFVEELGTHGRLERPLLGVLPRSAAQWAGLLDQAFPDARQADRGDWLVWNLRPFVLDLGRSPWFASRIGAERAATLARRVANLRALVLVPPGASMHVLSEDEVGAGWYRSRRLRSGPLATCPEHERAQSWLLAREGTAAAAMLRDLAGEHLETRSILPSLVFLVRPPAREGAR